MTMDLASEFRKRARAYERQAREVIGMPPGTQRMRPALLKARL